MFAAFTTFLHFSSYAFISAPNFFSALFFRQPARCRRRKRSPKNDSGASGEHAFVREWRPLT